MRKVAAGLLLAAAVAGCATLVAQPKPSEATLQPLLRALTEPVDTLKRGAERNEAEAEFAYAILAEHRLRGVRASSFGLPFRLQLALTPATIRRTPIYVPGVGGRPGTVISASTRVADPRVQQAEVVYGCIAALEAAPHQDSAEACGGSALYARLQTLWAEAKIDPRTTPEALARLTCDPAEVDKVTQAAGEAYNAAGDAYENEVETARAILLTDRVIAVCGDAGPGWRARAMRADIAMARGVPAEALRLLGPVPRPAPRPVGYGPAWLAMNAYASAGDWAGYARQRDALMAAADRALAVVGRERERLTAGGWRVVAYDVDLDAAYGRRTRRIFLATPAGQREAPRAVYLHRTTPFPPLQTSSDVGGWALTEYQCYDATTLKRWDGDAEPDAAEVRRLAIERLGAPTEPPPTREEGQRAWTPGSCGFPREIAPEVG